MDRPPLLDHQTGAVTATSREWDVRADQWSRTYYLLREGRLYLVEDDNKEQTHSEWELDVEKFLRDHAGTEESPCAEIVAAMLGGVA
jgi:hypothetical protein